MITPLRCAIAGTHGADCRDASGNCLFRYENNAVDAMYDELQRIAQQYPGVYLENKECAFSVHYRHVQESAIPLAREIARVVSDYDDWNVQHGKCVYELKPDGFDKGKAIGRFMETPEFRGRYPVFIGDDYGDESGFIAVNRLGGLSIKVGAEPTNARWRLPNVAGVHAWLAQSVSRNGDKTGNGFLCRV